MPNNASQKKRLRQSQVRRLKNREVRAEIRTRTKQLLAMESHSEADGALSELYRILDRAARRGIIKLNTASRQKARIAKHVQSLT